MTSRRSSLIVGVVSIVSTLICCLLSQYIAGATVVGLFLIWFIFEERRSVSRRKEIDALYSALPAVAHVRCDRGVVDKPAEEVVPGDILVIIPGQAVAVDGQVYEGSGSVDEKLLTGEEVPALKNVGSRVFAGSVSLNGHIEVKALVKRGDSALVELASALEQSNASISDAERRLDFAVGLYAVFAVVVSAVLRFV